MKKIYAFFSTPDLAEKANFMIKDMVISSEFTEEHMNGNTMSVLPPCIYISAAMENNQALAVRDTLYQYGADEVIVLV